MKTNFLEKQVVNSFIRQWAQQKIEIPKMIQLGGRPAPGRMLEIGCGSGFGVRLILQNFEAKSVDAVDVDPKMVIKSKKRLYKEIKEKKAQVILLPEGEDAFPHTGYTAAFSFGALHHILNWQNTTKNVKNALAPNGKFYMLEFYKPLICNRFVRIFIHHPQQNRFDHKMLCSTLSNQGFKILGKSSFFNLLGIIVAQKEPA